MTRGDIILGNGRKFCLKSNDGSLILYAPYEKNFTGYGDGTVEDYFSSYPSKCEITTERWAFELEWSVDWDKIGDDRYTLESVIKTCEGTYHFPKIGADGEEGNTVPEQDHRYKAVNYQYIDESGTVHNNEIHYGTPYGVSEIETALSGTSNPSGFRSLPSSAFWEVRLAGLSDVRGAALPSIPVFDYKCMLRVDDDVESIEDDDGETIGFKTMLYYDISHVIWIPSFYCSVDERRDLSPVREIFCSSLGFGPSTNKAIFKDESNADDETVSYNATTANTITYDQQSDLHKFILRGKYFALPLFRSGEFTYSYRVANNGGWDYFEVQGFSPAPTHRWEAEKVNGVVVGNSPNHLTFPIRGGFRFTDLRSRWVIAT